MKKVALLVLALFTCILQGCACNHSWLSATCNMPMICEKCGETNGSPSESNHKWSDSTCNSKAVCEICDTKGEFGDHIWVDASYECAKYCSVCGLEEGFPLLDSSDVRYVLAACAYRTAYNAVDLPSSMRIERVRYSYVSDKVPYITVVLDCSAENALGGRTLVRCYAYNVTDSKDTAMSVLTPGEYSTYQWPYNNANIYCRIESVFDSPDDESFLKWDELIPDLVLQRYDSFFD